MARSDFSIKVKGLDQVQSKLKRAARKCPEAAAGAINKSLLVIEKEVKENLSGKILNVGTARGNEQYRGGRLRKSFGVAKTNLASPRKLFGIIGSNVVYARIHELGGRAGRGLSVTLPARKYFSKAIKSAMPSINRLFDKAISKVIKA